MAKGHTLTLCGSDEKENDNMKKKILALVLLGALLSTVLAGCGDGNAEQTPGDRAAANELIVGIAQDLDESLGKARFHG